MTQEQLEKAVKLHNTLDSINDAIDALKGCTRIFVGDHYRIYATPEIITRIMFIYEVEKINIEREIAEL